MATTTSGPPDRARRSVDVQTGGNTRLPDERDSQKISSRAIASQARRPTRRASRWWGGARGDFGGVPQRGRESLYTKPAI